MHQINIIIGSILCLLIGVYSCTPKTSEAVSQSTTQVQEAQKPLTTQSNESSNIAIPIDPSIRMGELDNGLKYYIRKNNKPENRAELRLALKAGAMQEDDDQQGLAHFVEHMAFNGSKNFKKNELVNYLESIGTKFGPDLNAYTSFDETVYMLQVRTDSTELLNKGMLVLEDWAGGLDFDHEEIDKERGVVESEWRSRLSANERMFNKWLPVLYYNSRYAKRLPIGKPEIIRNADYETVKRFYRDWYRPDLMAVVVVGDVDIDDMEKQIKSRFGKLKNPSQPRPIEKYPVPKHSDTKISITTDKEAPFTTVELVYKHDYMPVTDLNSYRQNIVHRLYDNMLSERLSELTQSANPPFNFAYSGFRNDVGDLAMYSSYAMVPEGGAAKALEVLMTENERVKRHGFTATELERAKKRVLNQMEKAEKEKDKTESRRFAMRYVYHFLDDNPIPSISDEVKMYHQFMPSIQLREINQLASKWVTDENRVVSIMAPEKEDVPMPSEADILELMNEVSDKEISPYVDEVNDGPLLDKSLSATPLVSDNYLEVIDARELILQNGARIILKHTDFKNDEVLFQAFGKGGNSLYPDLADYIQLRSAASIIKDSGLGNFDNSELSKKIAGKTVRVSPYISSLYQGFRGSASPDDLETLLKMVYMTYTMPRKDKDVLSSFVTKQKSIYKNLMVQPQYYFYNQASKIKYNNNPRRGFPTAESMEQLDIDKVYSLFKERFSGVKDMTFLIIGNYDKDNIEKLVSTYIGNIPEGNSNTQWKDNNINMQNGVVTKTLNYGEAPKALVDLTFHGDYEYSPENNYNFKSLVDILSIKMRESMREDKGGVYGVRVNGNFSRYPKSTYSINISFNADPPKVEELINTAIADIKNAQKMGADKEVLTKVIASQRQGMIKSLKENRFWLNTLSNSLQNDGKLSEISLERLDKYSSQLDEGKVKQAANKYFDWNNYFKIVLMPDEQ